MCECHPLTSDQKAALRATEGEPNTVEDWRDLHDAIEGYRRRRAARHVRAHVAGDPPTAGGRTPSKRTPF
jgi:hypothetical protein